MVLTPEKGVEQPLRAPLAGPASRGFAFLKEEKMKSHNDGPGQWDDLMTPEELMGMLKIRKSTLYAWVGRNVIPYVKLESTDDTSRGLLRFLRSDVSAWLSKRKRGVGEEGA